MSNDEDMSQWRSKTGLTYAQFCAKFPRANATAAERRTAREPAQTPRPAAPTPTKPKATLATFTADLDKQIARANPPKVISTIGSGQGVRTHSVPDNGGLRRVTGRELASALGWHYSVLMNSVGNGTIKEKPIEKITPLNLYAQNFTWERAAAEAICRRHGKQLAV